jgi:hypothetical protein
MASGYLKNLCAPALTFVDWLCFIAVSQAGKSGSGLLKNTAFWDMALVVRQKFTSALE